MCQFQSGAGRRFCPQWLLSAPIAIECSAFTSWINRPETFRIWRVLVPTIIVFTWTLTSFLLTSNSSNSESFTKTSLNWLSKTAYVITPFQETDRSETFSSTIVAQERAGPQLQTWVQADDVGVVWFSCLDGSWRSVECLFPHISQLDAPWLQFLLVCSVDLAQLKQSLCLNRKALRLAKSSSRNFWHLSRLWDLVLWKGQKAGLGVAGVTWLWEEGSGAEFPVGLFPSELCSLSGFVWVARAVTGNDWSGLLELCDPPREGVTGGLVTFLCLPLTGVVWDIWGILICSAWKVTSFTKAENDGNAFWPWACCNFWTYLDHLL